MSKPQSMSVKEWLIKRMSLSLVIPEKVIDAVITNQFDSANDALKNNKSIEISGFGKFVFNDKKAIHQMNKYLSQKLMFETMLSDSSLPDVKRRNIQMKLDTTLGNIKILKPKIDEIL